ncbi:HAD hydrolase family protein [Microbacterium sp.]|uniref:HAD hydrolase family protein n=1 Tax=Microbacterium sp. TaxID=51671 RepID=UPI003C70C5D9
MLWKDGCRGLGIDIDIGIRIAHRVHRRRRDHPGARVGDRPVDCHGDPHGTREGALVYLCTGRSAGDLHPDVRAIGFDGAITNGGAFATRGGEALLSHPMPRDDVDHLVSYLEAHGIEFTLQSNERVYASTGIFEMMSEFARVGAERRAEDLRRIGVEPTSDGLLHSVIADAATRWLPLAAADLDTVAKAVFVSTRSDDVDRLQADLGERFHVIPGSIPLPGGSNGEISPAGITKGAAILQVLAILDRPATEAIGIGDSWNDVEMFDVCGVSVAMAGADPELQARADRVTTGVLDDGVWNAFVELGLV